MKQLIKPIRPLLLLLLAFCGVSSCLDSSLLSTSDCMAPDIDDADMYMNINVPRTYASGVAYDKETAVETLDVLVFSQGEVDESKYYVYAACKGTLTASANKFQVVMPVGNNFLVHVFINCHEAMAAKGFYNSRGTELTAMLARLTTGIDNNAAGVTSLPMHGYITDVSIDKSKVNSTITVPVLRAVAAAQVMTNVTVTDGEMTAGKVTDGESGKQNFQLREFYTYFYPDSGRVAPLAEAYKDLAVDEKDETRDITTVSLPANHHVSDTREAEEGHPKPYKIISDTEVEKLGTFYLYENKPWSDTGFDQPDADHLAATTRLVVGGVYADDKNADGTPRVTYYRVDFADADGKLGSVLRNHKYTFSIDKVSGSGYDTPDDAATGVPINIYVSIIDWTDELKNVDFNGENHLYSETKYIELPRNAGSSRTIELDSDVDFGVFWSLAFDATSELNGNKDLPAVTVAKDALTASIENSRYKVELTADTKHKILKMTVTAKKAYSDNALITATPATEAYADALYVTIKNLKVTYRLNQVDKSPDDWGNGGTDGGDLGSKDEEMDADGVENGNWDESGGNAGGEGKLD